jgi:hypothetical protein
MAGKTTRSAPESAGASSTSNPTRLRRDVENMSCLTGLAKLADTIDGHQQASQ